MGNIPNGWVGPPYNPPPVYPVNFLDYCSVQSAFPANNFWQIIDLVNADFAGGSRESYLTVAPIAPGPKFWGITSDPTFPVLASFPILFQSAVPPPPAGLVVNLDLVYTAFNPATLDWNTAAGLVKANIANWTVLSWAGGAFADGRVVPNASIIAPVPFNPGGNTVYGIRLWTFPPLPFSLNCFIGFTPSALGGIGGAAYPALLGGGWKLLLSP